MMPPPPGTMWKLVPVEVPKQPENKEEKKEEKEEESYRFNLPWPAQANVVPIIHIGQ
jgi:hypothetical protein